MRRMMISLSEKEREALYLLATRQRRNIREQAALLVREQLENLGLLIIQENRGYESVGGKNEGCQ